MAAFENAGQWKSNAALVAAKSLLAVARCKQLRVLQGQLDVYRQRIEALFASHPDSNLFGSLPRAGPNLGPRLLSEIGSDRTLYEDPQGLQCMAGTASVLDSHGPIWQHPPWKSPLPASNSGPTPRRAGKRFPIRSDQMKNVIGLIAVTIGILPVGLKAEQPFLIVRAMYGAGEVQRDVTAAVRQQVKNGKIQFDVQSTPLGGDPIFGKVKTLTVQYQDANGIFSVSASEGERLVIPNEEAIPVNSGVESIAPAGAANPERIAPDGTYFLLERVSVKSESGISSLSPGTRVEKIGETALAVRVKSGEYEFEVAPEKLTNSLDTADAQETAENQRRRTNAQAMQRKLVEDAIAQKKAQELANAEAARQKTESARQIAKQNAKRIRGTVLQATNEGLMIDGEGSSPVASSMAGIGGGGGVYVPPDPNGKGRPTREYGTFWLVGHPQQGSKVKDDAVDVDAFEDGVFSYTTVMGAQQRIKKYQVLKAFE
jgi:hypothetical protein